MPITTMIRFNGITSTITIVIEEPTASYTETSSIPLTTIFTPGEGCIGDDVFITRTISHTVWYEPDARAKRNACYPSSYYAYQFDSSDMYYSPGICPQSYMYISTSVSTHNNAPNTTFAICCPE